MRNIFVASLLYPVIAVVVVFSLSAQADQKHTLKRRPGLWQVSASSGGSPAPTTMKQCADETTDAQMMQLSDIQSENCKMSDFVKTEAGYEFSSECQLADSKVVSKGVFSGDFNSSYSGEVVTTMNPPLLGQSESRTTMTAKWLGACPSGMKAGDMQIGDGVTIDLEQAKQGAKMAAEMMKNPAMLKAMKNAMAGAKEAAGALEGLAADATVGK
jgi:hypothetical protein